MLFDPQIQTLFKDAYEEESLYKVEAGHSALQDEVSMEIEMQRLCWEYKNMREKKRSIE